MGGQADSAADQPEHLAYQEWHSTKGGCGPPSRGREGRDRRGFVDTVIDGEYSGRVSRATGLDWMGGWRAAWGRTGVKLSLPYGRRNVCAMVAVNRLVKTTSMYSSGLYGGADTDLGLQENGVPWWHTLGARQIAERGCIEPWNGSTALAHHHHVNCGSRPTFPAHNCEQLCRRFYPMGEPTEGRSQRAHQRPRAVLRFAVARSGCESPQFIV